MMDKEDHHWVLNPTTICIQWYRLWSAFGFTDYQWTSRVTKVEEYAQKLIDHKLFNYEERLIKRREFLKRSLEDYEEIIERTGLPSSIEKTIFENSKLKEQEIYLDEKMHELLILEGQLLQQRTDLENQEKHLCDILHTSPIEYHLPLSLVQINAKLQDHIKLLKELKDQRLTQVSSYYLKLKDYSERLEWTPASPSSTVEYLLLEQFDRCLTADDLDEIERTIRQLENQIELQNKRFRTLYHQLTRLYERLHKDHCLAYRTGSENINAFVIKQLEHELNCCREERMKNGKEYCHFIRQQINDLLTKAHLGPNERVIFDRLDFETLSSDLLDAYDAEYDRLYQLYEKRRPVLDAYEKWNSFWQEYLAFIKASTDPGRFHIRGYNAEIEARKRKKFQRELPIIEEEFLKILSEQHDPKFLVDNIPIRQLYDQTHHQITSMIKPINTPARTPSRRLGVTPVRAPVTTPRRAVNKEPFVLGTAITSTARRPVKTPANNVARKILSKAPSHTDAQPTRVKSRAPPPPVAPPPEKDAELPACSSISTGDQSLDFSLLHTMKNVYGQIKILTSTPNSSFHSKIKTAHNTIGQRKSKRRSKRTPLPILASQSSDDEDETLVCL